MHPATQAVLLAAIRAELQADPAGRGYNGKSVAEIVALLNTPTTVVAAPSHRDVPISDVRGYLEARLIMVRLEDWVTMAPPGDARDAARTLLRITSDDALKNFTTSTVSGRTNVLGLFNMLVQAEAGGLTGTHYADISAMTLAPAAAPVVGPPRWSLLIDGISGEEGHPGPPNAADEALIQEALDG